MKKFWMVLKDDTPSKQLGNFPKVRHANVTMAQAEAERLCKENNCAFYILEAVGHVSPKREVVWDTSDD